VQSVESQLSLEHIASFLRVEEQAKQETSLNQVTAITVATVLTIAGVS
jgi:hypothetical protein